jgi:hypothetical protein
MSKVAIIKNITSVICLFVMSWSCDGHVAQCIFWPIFVRFRVKLKIEVFKKTIGIPNYNAHGVTKIIFFKIIFSNVAKVVRFRVKAIATAAATTTTTKQKLDPRDGNTEYYFCDIYFCRAHAESRSRKYA